MANTQVIEHFYNKFLAIMSIKFAEYNVTFGYNQKLLCTKFLRTTGIKVSILYYIV